MMRRVIAILLILVALPAFAQQRDLKNYAGDKKVNFGIKGGFNSSLMIIRDLTVNGKAISDVQNEYKLGYFASLFMRINFDRHFLQPELSYNINRCEVHFTEPAAEGDLSQTARQYAISSRISCIELPILYGYNFMKEGPYQMAAFGGPTFRYIWDKHSRNNYKNFHQMNIEEELYPLNASFTLGVAVTISRVFFDFRYDIGLHNISKELNYEPATYDGGVQSSSDKQNQLHFHRNYNTLSFSLGLYF